MQGKWVIPNTRSAMEPFLTYSDAPRSARKGVRVSGTRGGNMGDAHDNNTICSQILHAPREARQAARLPTYAHWRLDKRWRRLPTTR